MNLDLFIFSAFLAISLLLGIFSSKKVANISEYSIGNRNFSTSTMIATIVATWVGGAFISYGLTETYRQGIYFAIPAIADCLGMMLIGLIFAPRMGEFLGKFSIAEVMGQMFGSKVRAVTVIFSLIVSIGSLGVQFKVSSKVLELIFGTSGVYATILSAVIVILYSAIGGIRAVTFTDVIQFFTFGCLIPAIGIILWQAMGENSSVMIWHTLSKSPLFDISAAFDLKNPKFYEMLGLCMMFIFPQFEPMVFQRVSIGRSVNQVAKSFKTAALICFIMQCIIIVIGILILSVNPNLNPEDLIKYIINNYTYTGLRGLVAIGIMAMVMSTADSSVNSVSIIFAHDLFKPLGFKWAQNELLVARITTVISGIMAIFLALQFDRVINLILSFTSLYVSIISVPFVFAVLRFRSSGNSVLAGMIGSLMVIIICRIFLGKTAIETFIPSLIANITFLFGYHYLMKQPGGWIKIQIPKSCETGWSIKQLICELKNFHFAKFMEKNSPNSELMYVYTGCFCFLSFGLNLITINYDLEIFSNFVYLTTLIVLFIATSLFIYPLWYGYFRNHPIIPHLFWNASVFYGLIFTGFMFAIASNFAPSQVAILLVNLVAIALLVRWQWALVIMLFGVFISLKFTNNYFPQLINSDQISWKLQIVYVLVLVSSLLLIFFKPRQESFETKELAYFKDPLLDESKKSKVQKYCKKLDAVISQMFFNFYK